MRTSLLIMTAAAGLSLSGCGPLGPGSMGELGNGLFTYACDSDSDPMCDSGATGQAMPKRVALGSRFSVTFTATDNASAIVEPVSEDFLTKTETVGASFKAVGAGVGGLLAKRGETVLDLYHVEISAVDHVQVDASGESIHTVEGISALELAPGETAELRGFAVDASDQVLAGALSCEWSTADDTVGEILTLATDNVITVQANQPGVTTLRLELEDAAVEVQLTVGDGGGTGGGGAGGGGGA